jgi:hypothetical protein
MRSAAPLVLGPPAPEPEAPPPDLAAGVAAQAGTYAISIGPDIVCA